MIVGKKKKKTYLCKLHVVSCMVETKTRGRERERERESMNER